jgi:hypothetical protein
MKKTILLLTFIIVLAGSVFGDYVEEVWNVTYHGGNNDYAKGIDIDNEGNVYVTGMATLDGRLKYHTIKYNSSGDVMWNATYSSGDWPSTTIDYAQDIAVDGSGNVYVTGYTPDPEGATQEPPGFYTIKYNSSGDEIWGVGTWYDFFSHAYAIAVDSSENVYVTGRYRINQNIDNKYYYHTIKYDSDGNEVWNVTDGIGHANDAAYDIVVDDSGNVYVTGSSFGAFHTIKYNSSGNQIWNVSYTGGTFDHAYGIAVDSAGNIYVTGVVDSNYYTIKYDSDGNEIWNATHNSGSSDTANGIVVDNEGNVYVTGSSPIAPPGNNDYYTIKYDSDGNEIWNKRYGTTNNDYSRDIAIDSMGNVYVTGISKFYSLNDYYDNYYTIKYSQQGFLIIDLNQSIDSNLYDKVTILFKDNFTFYNILTFKKNGNKVVEFNINDDVNLSEVIVDMDGPQTVVSGLSDVNGVTGTFNMYVERMLGTDWVYICPNANSIEQIFEDCPDVFNLLCDGNTYGDYSCSVEGNFYKISGLTGTGGGEGEGTFGDGDGVIPEFSTIGVILAVMIIGIFSMFIIKKKK